MVLKLDRHKFNDTVDLISLVNQLYSTGEKTFEIKDKNFRINQDELFSVTIVIAEKIMKLLNIIYNIKNCKDKVSCNQLVETLNQIFHYFFEDFLKASKTDKSLKKYINENIPDVFCLIKMDKNFYEVLEYFGLTKDNIIEYSGEILHDLFLYSNKIKSCKNQTESDLILQHKEVVTDFINQYFLNDFNLNFTSYKECENYKIHDEKCSKVTSLNFVCPKLYVPPARPLLLVGSEPDFSLKQKNNISDGLEINILFIFIPVLFILIFVFKWLGRKNK